MEAEGPPPLVLALDEASPIECLGDPPVADDDAVVVAEVAWPRLVIEEVDRRAERVNVDDLGECCAALGRAVAACEPDDLLLLASVVRLLL